MKLIASDFFLVLLLTTQGMLGQGLLIDQQTTNIIEGSVGIQTSQPLGQLFTPTLSSVGFVSFNLYDADPFHSLGANVYANLRSNSINGTVIGSTSPVFMPNDFYGITNFLFSIPVTVTPGSMYCFELVIGQNSDGFASYESDGSYLGGNVIFQGTSVPGYNLWFREGIVVPEPSAFSLVISCGVFLYVLRKKPVRRL